MNRGSRSPAEQQLTEQQLTEQQLTEQQLTEHGLPERPPTGKPGPSSRRAVVRSRAVGGHGGVRPSSRGRCGRSNCGWTPSPAPSRSSRCPTATSGCAATSTRASRTGCPGTYLNSVYERRPLPYAEAGYGYPESGQTVIDVTNGKIIRLLVDDEPFDVRYGRLHRHERCLDLRAGTLQPGGRVALAGRPYGEGPQHSPGLVDPPFRRRDRLRGRATGRAARVVLQSELVANEELPASRTGPPGGRRAGGTAGTGRARRPGQPADAAAPHPPQPDRGGGRRRPPDRGAGRRHRAGRLRGPTGLGPGHRHGDPAARADDCGWSSSSATAGRRCARCRPCATRRPRG